MTTFATDLYLLVAAFGLALPVSYAGLPVVGQSAFVSVGAFGTFLLAAHGVPLLLAVATSVAIAAVAGYAIGFAAMRLAGASLALATWGLAWLAYVALVQFPTLSGGSEGLVHESPARLVSRSLGVVVTLQPWVHALVAAVFCVLLAAALIRTRNGPWGLDWAALRTGPAIADSVGVPVQRRRRALLSASAAIGALGGAGMALVAGVIAPIDYSPLLSLQLFVAVLVGTAAAWWGPPLGVAILAALPSASDGIATAAGIDPLRARGVLTAVLLVAVLVLRSGLHQLISWLPARGVTTAPPVPATAADPPGRRTTAALRGVTVEFGAVRALDDVSFDVRPGEVHALIGPNGSGKTTALRVLAGLVAPASGAVQIGNDDVRNTGSAAPRVAAGVARTPQHTALLRELPAQTQAAIGARTQERAPLLGLRQLLGTPAARAVNVERSEQVRRALDAVDLAARGQIRAESLDSAEQRLLQIARVVATGAGVLLIDEPAAGMSAAGRRRLAEVLRALADDGAAVLLVEHDMTLVGRLADRVTVLSAGRVVVTGTPSEIQRHPEVRRAYLGEVDLSAAGA